MLLPVLDGRTLELSIIVNVCVPQSVVSNQATFIDDLIGYCGNSLGEGSVVTADSGCLDTCTANKFEYVSSD